MTIVEDEKKLARVTELLLRLKKINRTYQLCNEEQRGRLLSASEGLINSLVAEGYERVFVETLLICGKDFLKTLYPEDKGKDILVEYEDIKVMFS